MADVMSPSPMDYSDNRFQFLSTSSKLSEDSFGSMSPLSPAMRDERGRNPRSCCINGSVSSYGQLSNCSDASSMTSVFIRNKCNDSTSTAPGNDYSTHPSRKSSCPSNIGTTTGNNGKNNPPTMSRLYPTKSGHDEGSPRKKPSNGKMKKTQEVTYTITDASEDDVNQVVILPPPPPHDPDSDNDSVTGCDLGGSCSPRHYDWHDSRDLGKSQGMRTSHGNNRCLCGMLLIFVLSTAGLSTVLVLVYLGNLQLAAIPNVRAYGSETRARLGEGALMREVCETGECLKTSSSILSRMNKTTEPCDDFYAYACGGFSKEVDLSWFKTRVREFPDEIAREHRKSIIDHLSDSFGPEDNKLMKSSKEIFRSCLFRSEAPDTNIKSIVSEIFDSLGGLTSTSTDASEWTHLLANVTRMFGASPFFKVVVHAQNKVSLISQLSEYIDPVTAKKDLSRQKHSSPREDSKVNMAHLTGMLSDLISNSVTKSEAKGIVSSFFRLEENIRRILSSGSRGSMYGSDEEDGTECDSPTSVGHMQSKYNGFGIDWFLFMQSVLDMEDVSHVNICQVDLSLALQRFLGITPKYELRQFILLHTLLHSDLKVLYLNDFSGFLQSGKGKDPGPIAETKEEQCVGLLLHYIPSLEKFSDCDENTLKRNKRTVLTTLNDVRSSLYSILVDDLRIPPTSAGIVANSTSKPIVKSIKSELDSNCAVSNSPPGAFSQYNFTANMLRVIQHHNSEYYMGRLQSRAPRDLGLTALWISANGLANHRARSGPVIYNSDVPKPILYGSLGTFLATRVAGGLTIDDLLDHHYDGVLNNSVVLYLALKLKCFAKMYSSMNILDFGSEVYKVNGEQTKDTQWKDQLALRLIHKAWNHAERTLSGDHFIPGLAYTRPQLFFLSYAQTMCEKVNNRGILEHYVSNNGLHADIPSHQRLNGILRNSNEFASAFQCNKGSYMNPMDEDRCRIFPKGS